MSSRNRQQTTQQNTQTQNQAYSGTNTFGWMTPPDTADVEAMRGFEFSADPRVPYTFAKARQNISDTFSNPLGANVTPALRDAMLRANLEDLSQQEAQALREENYTRQGLNYAKLADVATMTQPRMVQTGQSGTSSGTSSGTASGSTTQQNSLLPSLIQGGSAVGGALLM